MKKLMALLLILILIVGSAAAEEAETVTCMGITVDRNTEHVDFGKKVVYDWEPVYAFLQQLPNLKSVDMFDTVIGLQVFNKLNELFPGVQFTLQIRYGEHRVRTDQTAFSTLWAGGQKLHTYDEIAMLRWCRNLYALDIGHHPVKKLDFLYDLPELRVLIVALNDLTDITPIASLKHLEYLEIFHNDITDLTPLSGLEYLMDLNLVKNQVSDLEPLMNLKRLKRLWLYNCDKSNPSMPTEEMVAQLQEALPDCHIDWTHTSTAGGWRSHSHYKTIFRMFRKHVYEPFDDSEPENMPEPWRTERLGQTEE